MQEEEKYSTPVNINSRMSKFVTSVGRKKKWYEMQPSSFSPESISELDEKPNSFLFQSKIRQVDEVKSPKVDNAPKHLELTPKFSLVNPRPKPYQTQVPQSKSLKFVNHVPKHENIVSNYKTPKNVQKPNGTFNRNLSTSVFSHKYQPIKFVHRFNSQPKQLGNLENLLGKLQEDFRKHINNASVENVQLRRQIHQQVIHVEKKLKSILQQYNTETLPPAKIMTEKLQKAHDYFIDLIFLIK